jgi:hypothetical protein
MLKQIKITQKSLTNNYNGKITSIENYPKGDKSLPITVECQPASTL